MDLRTVLEVIDRFQREDGITILEVQVLEELKFELVDTEMKSLAAMGEDTKHPNNCRNCEGGGHPDFCNCIDGPSGRHDIDDCPGKLSTEDIPND